MLKKEFSVFCNLSIAGHWTANGRSESSQAIDVTICRLAYHWSLWTSFAAILMKGSDGLHSQSRERIEWWFRLPHKRDFKHADYTLPSADFPLSSANHSIVWFLPLAYILKQFGTVQLYANFERKRVLHDSLVIITLSFPCFVVSLHWEISTTYQR